MWDSSVDAVSNSRVILMLFFCSVTAAFQNLPAVFQHVQTSVCVPLPPLVQPPAWKYPRLLCLQPSLFSYPSKSRAVPDFHSYLKSATSLSPSSFEHTSQQFVKCQACGKMLSLWVYCQYYLHVIRLEWLIFIADNKKLLWRDGDSFRKSPYFGRGQKTAAGDEACNSEGLILPLHFLKLCSVTFGQLRWCI